ncbi:MAG: hypothetical protein V4508_11740 [Pseudomonadota bacterium]
MRANDDSGLIRWPRLWHWLLIPASLSLVQLIIGQARVQPIAYSEFKQLLGAGQVRQLRLAPQLITGSFGRDQAAKVLPPQRFNARRCDANGQCKFSTVRVADPALIGQLEHAAVQFEGEADNTWWPTLLGWVFSMLMLLWVLGLSRQAAQRSGPAGGPQQPARGHAGQHRAGAGPPDRGPRKEEPDPP